MRLPEKILGVDAGGTTYGIGLVDTATGLLEGPIQTVPSPPDIEGVIELLEPYQNNGRKIPIGFGFPGQWDKFGIITHAPNTLWAMNRPIFDEISHILEVPVFKINDLGAAARGVVQYANPETLALVETWSTGINGCLIHEGRVLYGAENGHIPVTDSPFGRMCFCGKRNCAEAYAGGKQVELMVEEFLLTHPEAREYMRLREIKDNNQYLDFLYYNAVSWAQQLYMEVIVPAMAHALATIHLAAPYEEIWWMGSFSKYALELPGIKQAIWDKMDKRIITNAQNIRFRRVPDEALVLGPALYALDQIKAWK